MTLLLASAILGTLAGAAVVYVVSVPRQVEPCLSTSVLARVVCPHCGGSALAHPMDCTRGPR